MINDISRLSEFEKDLKKLSKRYRTLEEDLQNFIKFSLSPFHIDGTSNGGIVEISDIGAAEPKIFKVLKFSSRSLKGKGVQSGIRLTYAYFQTTNNVEFIEIYYKGDQENENRGRIKDYLKKKSV